MSKKKIWDINKKDIVILKGGRYRWLRDKNTRLPSVGVVPIRVLVNIDDSNDTKRFFRDYEYEVEDCED